MFCINVILTVQEEEDIEAVGQLLAEAGHLTREEPGCLRFEVYHSQSDPRVYLLLEHWESEQAWQDHRNEQAFREIYQPKVLPLVERTPHISTLIE